MIFESRIGFDGQKEIFLLGIFLKVRKKANEIVFQRSNQFRSNFCRLCFSYVVVNLSTKEVKRGNCQSLIKDWIFLCNKHPDLRVCSPFDWMRARRLGRIHQIRETRSNTPK